MLLSLFNLVLSIFRTVYRSWIFLTFWGWFVLVVFPTLPALTILPTIGLFYLLGLMHKMTPLTRESYDKAIASFKKAYNAPTKTAEERVAEAVEQKTSLMHAIADNWLALFAYTATLGGGWVVHWLMRHMG